MIWSSRQAARQITDPSTPTGFRIGIVDSGDVDVYGAELDAQFAATDRLSFDGAFGITHYKVKDPVANSGPYLFPAQASPSYNFGATYSQPLGTARQFVDEPELRVYRAAADASDHRVGLVLRAAGLRSREQPLAVDFAEHARTRSRCSPTTCSTRRMRATPRASVAATGMRAAAPAWLRRLVQRLGAVRGRPREFGITVPAQLRLIGFEPASEVGVITACSSRSSGSRPSLMMKS